MTRHNTMAELLAVRDGEANAAVTTHLAECEVCRRELAEIDQRAAGLRALAHRRPPRDRWPVVRERVLAERRTARLRQTAWATVAIAAGLTLAIGVRSIDRTPVDGRPSVTVAGPSEGELHQLVTQSGQLEAALRDWDPRGRVLSGRAASVIAELEDRIAAVDAGIANFATQRGGERELVNLWRDRVVLMDALVNAHVTQATYVGF